MTTGVEHDSGAGHSLRAANAPIGLSTVRQTFDDSMG